MATAKLSTLPRELRDEIWMLALLPEPGVYQFNPDLFTPSEDTDGFEDERWMIPKRKYPTVMHLCQESRHSSLRIMAQEQKQEQEDGILPYYCIGSSARPFNPPTDTFWFSEESYLDHPWVINLDSVIGNRIHTIKNLALLPECVTLYTGRPKPSIWNSFRLFRLIRFVSLRRIDIVFEETVVDGDGEFRLEKWTKGLLSTPRFDTYNVDEIVNKVRASVLEVFQDAFERKEVKEEELPLPEGAPDWHDGSEITFHASRMVKIKA